MGEKANKNGKTVELKGYDNFARTLVVTLDFRDSRLLKSFSDILSIAFLTAFLMSVTRLGVTGQWLSALCPESESVSCKSSSREIRWFASFQTAGVWIQKSKAPSALWNSLS